MTILVERNLWEFTKCFISLMFSYFTLSNDSRLFGSSVIKRKILGHGLIVKSAMPLIRIMPADTINRFTLYFEDYVDQDSEEQASEKRDLKI